MGGVEALVIADPPELSAEDLASGLQASQATRMLVQAGPIEHRRRRGERSDYFRVKPGALDAMVRQRAIHGVLTPLDPSLTLTRTQHRAIVGNRGNRRPLIYAGYASPCKPLQRSATPDRTLVMCRSAVRVRSSALLFTCKTRKTRNAPMFWSGALSAVRQQ
jgi:hypothetical protein